MAALLTPQLCASVLYNRLLVPRILYPCTRCVLSLLHTPRRCPSWAGINRSMGAGVRLSYFFVFPQHPTGPGTQKALKIMFDINIVITAMRIIISAQPLATAQRESGRAQGGFSSGCCGHHSQRSCLSGEPQVHPGTMPRDCVPGQVCPRSEETTVLFPQWVGRF